MCGHLAPVDLTMGTSLPTHTLSSGPHHRLAHLPCYQRHCALVMPSARAPPLHHYPHAAPSCRQGHDARIESQSSTLTGHTEPGAPSPCSPTAPATPCPRPNCASNSTSSACPPMSSERADRTNLTTTCAPCLAVHRPGGRHRLPRLLLQRDG